MEGDRLPGSGAKLATGSKDVVRLVSSGHRRLSSATLKSACGRKANLGYRSFATQRYCSVRFGAKRKTSRRADAQVAQSCEGQRAKGDRLERNAKTKTERKEMPTGCQAAGFGDREPNWRAGRQRLDWSGPTARAIYRMARRWLGADTRVFVQAFAMGQEFAVSMARFSVATIVAAFILLWADGYGGEWLFAWTSPPATHFIYRAVAWACMCGAVLLVTRAPYDWPNIIVCGLVLSVAFIFARELAHYARPASGLEIHMLVALVLFAFLVAPTGLWYRSLKQQ